MKLVKMCFTQAKSVELLLCLLAHWKLTLLNYIICTCTYGQFLAAAKKVKIFYFTKGILLQTPLGGHGWRGLLWFCRFHRLFLHRLVERIL